jgi:hypothetical protein
LMIIGRGWRHVSLMCPVSPALYLDVTEGRSGTF